MRPIRFFLLAMLLPFLAACGALNAISDASTPMNAYTLSPLEAGDTGPAIPRHLIVEVPTSAGALANDRIQIKPVAFQAQYLPDGRWTEPAPALVQSLLVASFQNSAGFRLFRRRSL
jgi:cholesterol transport system auxiliary component